MTDGLVVDGLYAGYGKRPVLQGVGLAVQPGEIVALLGRNGAGRSTLVKALMGLVGAQAGQVHWRGAALRGLPPHRIAQAGIGYVPEQRDVFPGLTVHQNLLLGRQRVRQPGAPAWPMDELYALFPSLAQRRDTDAGVLSGGEQQMLTLCRTLMGAPLLLLVDEPTEGLAPAVVQQVAQCLTLARQRGVGVLLVEQKLAIALAISQRCLVMGHGRIVFTGTPAQLQAAPAVVAEWLTV